MPTEKTPIRAVFTGATATGLAEYQTDEVVGVAFGGTGVATLTSNAILLGNGTSAVQSSSIRISGSSLSSSDSTLININEGLVVDGTLNVNGTTTITGNLTVTGTTTTVNSTTIDIGNSFTFEGATANDFETTLGVIDPTADRTINLPNVSGTVITTGNISDITGLTISQISDASFTITDDTSTTTTISLGETLKIAGGTGLTSALTGDTITLDVALSDFATPITNLTEISNVANDDVFIAIDTSGGGLKKITRSTIVSGLAASSALSNIVEDTTPQLGGSLDVNGNSIVSVSNGNISIVPNGSGKVILDGDGSASGVSVTDGLIDIRSSTGNVSKIKFYCEVSNAHFQTLQASPHSASSSAVLTLPTLTGNLVGTGDSGTVTNTMLANPSFTIVDDTSTTGTITLGESLLLAGGTGITSVISGDSITFSIDNTVATLTGTETFTNKTLTTPIISSISNTGTLTLPTSTDTLVGRATTDTLTNKTLTSPKINENVVVTATATELNFTDGVTSNIQTQLDAKASRAFAIAQAVALG